MLNSIEQQFAEHAVVLQKTRDELLPQIEQAAVMMVDTLKAGKKVLLFGNGGSAADAQHIAAELVCKYSKQRRGLPSIALTTDTSALTAIANDYSYDHLFSRQVESLAVEGDMLIGISTSGSSPNVLRGLEQGKAIGCKLLGLSGKGGGEMGDVCDINLVVPSDITAHIQEIHIIIGHALCQIVDNHFD